MKSWKTYRDYFFKKICLNFLILCDVYIVAVGFSHAYFFHYFGPFIRVGDYSWFIVIFYDNMLISIIR